MKPKEDQPERNGPAVLKCDADKFAWLRDNVYVAVICDILDELGHRHQAMHHRLRPLQGDNCTIIGRARTVKWMEMDYIHEDPYGPEIAVVDSLRPGDVIIHSTDFGLTNAPWGELMSTASKMRGAVGCICDGLTRDCKKIMELNFPVFTTGIRPLDSRGRGRVMAYDVPIRCGDVLVHTGELVMTDYDGIVVVPRAVEEEVIARAMDRVTRESSTRQELFEGKLLKEVYAKYGVL